MGDKSLTLRKTLSANIKRYREHLGLTQEKLAETAGISANMVNDIEGFRTWFSQRSFQSSATIPLLNWQPPSKSIITVYSYPNP